MVITLDDLATLLHIPEGHAIEGVRLLPSDHRPGLAVTIKGAGLRPHFAVNPLPTIDLAAYWAIVDQDVHWPPDPLETATRTVPRGTERIPPNEAKPLDVCLRRCGGLLRLRTGGLRCDKCGADAWGNLAYSSAVVATDPAKWPAFPGEALDYRGAPDVPAESRSGTESEDGPVNLDLHTGGPR